MILMKPLTLEGVQAMANEEEKVNHPKHYNAHPSGVECIDIVEHMNFNRGNAEIGRAHV